MSQTTITAGDASAGLVTAAGNDGTMVLQTGPAGSKVNAISFAADGTPTLLKVPLQTALPSMVRVNTANGYGSTNTRIRRWTNTVTNQGSDITYTDSATLGASFTVNTNGVYCISFSLAISTVAQWMAIGLNASVANQAPISMLASEVLAVNYVGTGSSGGNICWTGYLPSGSIIRPHSDGGAATPAQPAMDSFTITRVA